MIRLNHLKRAYATSNKIITIDHVNPKVVQFDYAVRGEIAVRAEQLKTKLALDPQSVPFSNIVSCNIGNPQQLGQLPITFFRQVSALIEYPDLLLKENRSIVSKLFPSDAIHRAQSLLKGMGGSSGAYSHSQGIPCIRENVAKFIEKRDGYPSDPNDIFLTAGASPAVQYVLQTIINSDKVGIMIPIPQYPLYTASIALYGGNAVPYYLDEDKDWGLSIKELKKSLETAKSQGTDVRALCIINPGNPTGQCLSRENMIEIVEFCHKERILLLADEVYQTNTYMPESLPFYSFKKVVSELGLKEFELISFHSVSKGMVGECGRRGGYFECTGIDPQVKELFYKLASVSLCPPVQGQIMVDLLVQPPQPSDVSFPLYQKEMESIYESLKRRAKRLANAFNQLQGVTCNPAQGAMYLFPQIQLPSKAIEAAKKQNKEPDAFYCLALLDATGVCVVPGSGFLQKKGTWHFRSTFLPPEDQLQGFIDRIKVFHESFMNKYH